MNESRLPTLFMRLRYAACIGQLFLLLLAHSVFSLTLPYSTLLFFIALIPISNVAYQFISKKLSDTRNYTASLIAFDTFLLTALLYCSGGPTNPFTIMYLVQVVLAAILLGSIWTAITTGISICGFGFLFYDSIAIPEWAHHGAHHGFSLHLHGMLFSYIIASSVLAYFLSGLLNALKEKERKLEQLETRAQNERRLLALTTASAGAAHELGTPLSTIMIIAHELSRELSKETYDETLYQDCLTLKEEVSRCKKILENLSVTSGDVLGEIPEDIPLKDLLSEAINPLPQKEKVILNIQPDIFLERIPVQALIRSFRSLIKNGLDSGSETVLVKAHSGDDYCSIVITDTGCGMSDEVKRRIGEPFFSTRNSSDGMGLGVYLSMLSIEQLGGTLLVDSIEGSGTTVTVKLPIKNNLMRAA